MASTVNQEQGGWWKFSEYRIVEGRIEPAPQSRLSSYDPWEQFRHSRSRGGNGEPPYQSLLALLQKINYRPTGSGFALKPESEVEICRWCSRHGLLGILPQTFDHIDLPAIATFQRTGDAADDFLSLRAELSAHTRRPDGWLSVACGGGLEIHPGARRKLFDSLAQLDADSSGLVSATIPFGKLKDLVDIPTAWWWQQPGAEYAEGGTRWSLSRLAEAYFPAVPAAERETHEYPLPLTPDFWQLYSEPVADFLHKAGWLQLALENIGPSDQWNFELGKEILDFLTASANRVLRLREGSLELVWLFPSLLASYAMMLAEDITEHHALHICPVCDTPFLSKAYQVKFCSDTCRYRHQKREQRRQQRENRVDHTAGNKSRQNGGSL